MQFNSWINLKPTIAIDFISRHFNTHTAVKPKKGGWAIELHSNDRQLLSYRYHIIQLTCMKSYHEFHHLRPQTHTHTWMSSWSFWIQNVPCIFDMRTNANKSIIPTALLFYKMRHTSSRSLFVAIHLSQFIRIYV